MMVGPFELKNIIIGAAVIVVVSVAMFLLKGILYFGFVFPIWMMVIGLVIVCVIIFLLASAIMGYLRWGREGFLFATARKKGLAVYIDAELGSEVAEFCLAEKKSPKDVVLKDEESGIKLDPGLLSADAKPMRFPGGLDIYLNSFYNFMPQSVRNHTAFKNIKDYFDRECQELNFLTVKEFIELISDPEHYLERNSLIKLNKYFKVGERKEVVKDADGNDVVQTVTVMNADGKWVPKLTYVRQFLAEVDVLDKDGNPTGQKEQKWLEQDLDLPAMIQLIAKARKDVSGLPLLGGLLAGNEAFKYNSVSYSSQHLGHVLMLYETKIRDQLKGQIDMLTIGIVALMILCGTGVCIYIASMAFGGGGGGGAA